DHDHELIRPQAVGPPDDEVAHFGGHVLALRAQPAVFKAHDAWRHAKPPGAGPHARREPWAAGAGIRPLRQLPAGAGAAVDLFVRPQLVEYRLVAGQPLGLPDGRRVPAHAQRFELAHDESVGALYGAEIGRAHV